jgi:tRNA A-37 threonylcarbamoyl transferase component Bud32
LESSSAPISAAHDPETMRATLQRFLGGPDGESYRVQDCRIANKRHRDGSRGTIEYELRLEDPATGHIWDQVVTGITFGGNRTRRIWESIRQASATSAAQTSASAWKPFAYVPDLDLLLQVFPNDYRLPGLAHLMAGPPREFLPSLMREFGPGDWSVQTWDATTVQYRVDMRAILLVAVTAIDARSARTSERRFFAKVYRDREHGRRAHQAQGNLHDRASAIETHLVIAKPIAYRDDLRTLVTEAVPGKSLSKIIRRGKSAQDAVRSAARAVADFHQLDVTAPHRSVADEISRLQEARAFLASARPDLVQEVSRMVDAVAGGLESAPSALIHGDLKPDHMLIDGDHVALIDFDLIGRADPIIDIAHLLGFLGKPQVRNRSRGEGTDVAQLFLDEYFTHVPDSWRSRLPLHHASTSIHKAVGLCRRHGGDEHGRVEDVLREGQAFLEHDASGSVPSYKRRLKRPTVC